jgi:hypothetical protein
MPPRTETRVFTVDTDRDIRVTTTQVLVLDGLDLAIKIAEVVAPAGGILIPGIAVGPQALEDAAYFELAEAMAGTLNRIKDRAARERLIFEIFRNTSCVFGDLNLQPVSREHMGAIFGPDMIGMFRVMIFVLQVQFGDFTGAVSTLIRSRYDEMRAVVAAAKAAKAAEKAAAET